MSKKAVNRKCHDILQRDLPCVLGREGLGAIWKGLGAIWKGLGANRKGLGARGSLGGGASCTPIFFIFLRNSAENPRF